MRGRFSTIDQQKLRQLIEVERLTQRQAAQRLGVCLSAIERACKRLGLRTQRSGPRSGAAHPDWKGGRVLIGRYWHVWVGADHPMATRRGYVAEHRLVVSGSLGRPLARNEVVHHRDGNPQNNALDNLELFLENSTHLRHELTGKTPNHSPEGKERMRAAAIATQNRLRLARDAQAKPGN